MEIEIREAIINDAEILFDWANDPETRQNSFTSKVIDWNDHIVWFKEKLINPHVIIYILHLNEKPIGVVRFEINETTIIGINVAPSHRGLGLGSKILNVACNRYWENNTSVILAYIKKGNIASRRIFEKAGFIFQSEGIFNKIECLIFKAEKNGSRYF